MGAMRLIKPDICMDKGNSICWVESANYVMNRTPQSGVSHQNNFLQNINNSEWILGRSLI